MNIWPVIHVAPGDRSAALSLALKNAEVAAGHGCRGVFLIAMDGDEDDIPEMALAVKSRFDDFAVGINLLNASPVMAVTVAIGYGLDAAWSDTPGVNSRFASPIALQVAGLLKQHPSFSFFGSVAFKYQPIESSPDIAAKAAHSLGMIPTTSGSATGVAAPVSKLDVMRSALGPNARLALASGLTPDNILDYAPFITDALVSTGICHEEHLICPKRLANFVENASIMPTLA